METSGAFVAAMCVLLGVVLVLCGMFDGLVCIVYFVFVKDLFLDVSVNGCVVVDGDVVISRGSGIAFEFALVFAEKFFGVDKVCEVVVLMVLFFIDYFSLCVVNEWCLFDVEVV